ncbi:MAG: aldehyde dehydrogenase family protein [Acidobacteriota bacterium]
MSPALTDTAPAEAHQAAPDPVHGTPTHGAPEGRHTSKQDIDSALAEMAIPAAEWPRVPAEERISLVEQLLYTFSTVGERWAEACREAEGLPEKGVGDGEEWLVGPYLVERNLRLLRDSLQEIHRSGRPKIPGPITRRPSGQLSARVFPHSTWDRLFFPGVTAEVVMKPGVDGKQIRARQAWAYREPDDGGIALVLGAGNVSSIGPTDALYKLFVENRAVIYKTHPVNEYLGPLLEEGLRPLVERGLLQVVYGGADEGDYLCNHPGVDEVHITGSDKTYEVIVFGSGEQGKKRLQENRPRLDKEVSAELGNVSPLIVVPGPWTASDLAYQAENIASSLVNNAGFNCNATRVVVQHAEWNQRRSLIRSVEEVLQRTPTRRAYYPGAAQRHASFLQAHPEAKLFGDAEDDELPWTLIPDLDPEAKDDICYNTEAFCGVFGDTALSAEDVPTFLQRAVDFCNDTLWGSLNVTLIVHPKTLADRHNREAFEAAVDALRFGTVAINHWAGISFGVMNTTWGAFPGHSPQDIQSGIGVVHNTQMFADPEKSILRAPFRAFPKAPWFTTHGSARPLGAALADFEAEPSLFKLPGVFWHALRG